MIWKKITPELFDKKSKHDIALDEYCLMYDANNDSVVFDTPNNAHESGKYSHYMDINDLFTEEIIKKYQAYHKTDWNVWYTIESARTAFNRLELPYIGYNVEKAEFAIVDRQEPLVPMGYMGLRLGGLLSTRKDLHPLLEPKDITHIMPLSLLKKPNFTDETMIVE